MQRIASRFGSEWQAGATFANSQLDYGQFVSSYGHVALVPARAVSTWTPETGAQAVGVTQPAGAGLPAITKSNAQGAGSTLWAQLGTSNLATTTQSGDQLGFTTTALQVQLTLPGILAPGEGWLPGQGVHPNDIRNGAKAAVLVDGATLQVVDTYGGVPTLTLFLDGLSHTIAVQHTGTYNASFSPIGNVTALVGTSVANNLVIAPIFHPTFVQASWRVLATAANTYSLYKTPFGGTEALVASGLTTGTHYSGTSYVPGVDLVIPSAATLTVNDSATFTTDVVMLAVEVIQYGTGTGSGVSTWTSPVYDFTDPGTQMLVAEWLQSTPLQSVTVRSGNRPSVDGSWSSATAALSSATTSDTLQYGTAGMQVLPPGRYGQLALTFAGVGVVAPWVRDLVVYATNPARDPILRRVPLGRDVLMGPQMVAYLGGIATWYADVRQAFYDLQAAASVSGAVDAYLAGYLADAGLAQVTGEQPIAAQSRVRGVLATAGGALSLVEIAQQVNLLVNGVTNPVAIAGGPGTLTATCGGVGVAQQASQAYKVTVPAAPYLGMPGLTVSPSSTAGTANAILLQHITTTLKPVKAAVTVVFTTGA